MKALIKAIRATKTLADERALIVKESAVIRTAFKEEGKHTPPWWYLHRLGWRLDLGAKGGGRVSAAWRSTPAAPPSSTTLANPKL